MRFSYFSPLMSLCTNIPLKCTSSGSMAPAGTISSTYAIQAFLLSIYWCQLNLQRRVPQPLWFYQQWPCWDWSFLLCRGRRGFLSCLPSTPSLDRNRPWWLPQERTPCHRRLWSDVVVRLSTKITNSTMRNEQYFFRFRGDGHGTICVVLDWESSLLEGQPVSTVHK